VAPKLCNGNFKRLKLTFVDATLHTTAFWVVTPLWFCRQVTTFRKNVLRPSTDLKMDLFKKLVLGNQKKGPNISEDFIFLPTILRITK